LRPGCVSLITSADAIHDFYAALFRAFPISGWTSGENTPPPTRLSSKAISEARIEQSGRACRQRARACTFPSATIFAFDATDLVLISAAAMDAIAARSVTATLVEARRASLQQAATAWVEAFERRDADAVTRWFADDIIAWYPRPEQSIGRAMNRDVWRAVFGEPNNRHPITTDTVVVADSGDLGCTMGRYRAHYERLSATVDTGGGPAQRTNFKGAVA